MAYEPSISVKRRYIMYKSVPIVLVLLLSLAGSIYAQGTVVNTSFFSPTLGGDRFVQIYLPEGYEPAGSTQYPAIYFLHGAMDDHTGYPFIIDILDSLIGNGIIEPVVVIKPDGRSVPYLVSWYTNSMLNGAFEDYIINDLIAYVETNYRVIPTVDKRFLMGHSAGGYGTMKLGLKHYDTYARIAAHSGVLELNVMMVAALPYLIAEYPGGPPYYWNPAAGFFSGVFFSLAGAFSPNFTNPPYFVDLPLDTMANIIQPVWDLWLLHNPPAFAATLPPTSDLGIYFDCGTIDEMGCYPQNTTFAMILDQLGIDYEFQSYVGDHSSQLPSRFPIGITFLVGLKGTVDYWPHWLWIGWGGGCLMRWLRAFVELPEGYDAADIEISTVAITSIAGEAVTPLYREGWTRVGDYDRDGIPDLAVRFNRRDVVLLCRNIIDACGYYDFTVSGKLNDGFAFSGNGSLYVLGNFGERGVETAKHGDIPTGFILYETAPNPFRTHATIRYAIPTNTQVSINVYDVNGRVVKSICKGKMPAGDHHVRWYGEDESGRKVASGVYFIRYHAGDYEATEKVLLIR
jgi:enterochelin esterase-like enzyme